MICSRRSESILECQQKLWEIRLKYFGIRRFHSKLNRDNHINYWLIAKREVQNCIHCFRNYSTSRFYDACLYKFKIISLVVPCRKYIKVENILHNVWIIYFHIISLSPLVDVTWRSMFNTDVRHKSLLVCQFNKTGNLYQWYKVKFGLE